MIKYTCEGPFILVSDARKEIKKKIEDVNQAIENYEDNTALTKKLDELNGRLDAIKNKHDELSLGRLKCGYNLTQQIEAIPFDGEDYEYECPKCGNKGHVMRMPEEEAEEG